MQPTQNANRTNIPADKPQGGETPFFARFLEGQETERQLNASEPKANRGTLKYPSDRDEVPEFAGSSNDAARIQTLKYPSDRDEEPYHAD
ncbi:MAG TPA: microviridin/marinostatin family tricyclic proteinase inhibitor [Pyrinomonadaceae bacterium]